MGKRMTGAEIVEDLQLHDTIGPKWCAEIAARIDAQLAEREAECAGLREDRDVHHDDHHECVMQCVESYLKDHDAMLDENITERDDANKRADALTARCQALEEWAAAVCIAWDVFDRALVEQHSVAPDHETFSFGDSPVAWAAYHVVDGLVGDFQLGDVIPTPPAATETQP